MKKLLGLVVASILLMSCGDQKEKKDGFQMNRSKQEVTTQENKGVPIDMSNKGIGPVKEVALGEIDEELSDMGMELFDGMCMACHMIDSKMIGPAIKGVTQRRSPEWIMNFIINPTEMLKKDPIAIALLKEANNAQMTELGMNEEDARALLEYFRRIDQ